MPPLKSLNSHQYRSFTQAENDGSYAFTDLTPGLYRIMVSPGPENLGFCAQPLDSVFTSRGEITENVDIELTRGVIISGTVTDKETGEPIPECPVYAEVPISDDDIGISQRSSSGGNPRIYLRGSSYSTGNAYTDDQGLFRITALPGHVFVSVSVMDGYSGIVDEDRRQYRLVGEDGSCEEVHLKLTKTAILYGIVYLPDGSPAEGVYVGTGSRGAITDNSGRFRISDTVFQTGRTYTLTAADYKHHLEGEGTADTTTQEPVEIHLRPVQYTSISGRVVDHNGDPIANEPIELYRYGGMLNLVNDKAAYSSADGAFTVDSLQVGQNYVLELRGGQFRSEEIILAGENKGPFELVLPLADRWLEGIVRDENGMPVINAEVSLWDTGHKETQTDENGKFRFDGLAAQSTRLNEIIINPPVNGGNAFFNIPTNTTYEFVLQSPNRYFGGQVVDLDGNPLANAQVTIEQTTSRRPVGTITDPLGRFIIPQLTGMTAQVTVMCDGYRALTREYMTNRDDVQIALEEIP